MEVIAARTAGRHVIPPRSPTPEREIDDTTDDEWGDIAGLIGMEDLMKVEEIIANADNWGPPPPYQATFDGRVELTVPSCRRTADPSVSRRRHSSWTRNPPQLPRQLVRQLLFSSFFSPFS